MVKNLSCVSCGGLKRFPHTFTTDTHISMLHLWGLHVLPTIPQKICQTHLDSSSFSSLSPSSASGRFKYSLSASSISLSSSSSDSSVKLNYFKKAILLISNWTNISSNSKFLPILFRVSFSMTYFKQIIWRKTLKPRVLSSSHFLIKWENAHIFWQENSNLLK